MLEPKTGKQKSLQNIQSLQNWQRVNKNNARFQPVLDISLLYIDR